MTEESPKLMVKQHRGRLSIGRRSRLSDSPKTPIRITTGSPDCFSTPPHSVSVDAPYSTPLNRRKRTCFAEESPSQDYDSSPLALLLSQDVRQSVIDVDWKWEDSAPTTKITSNKPKKIAQLKAYHISKRSTQRKSPEITQKKGFYKFKEELMQNMHRNPNGEDFIENDRIDSSLKENENNFQESNRIQKDNKVVYQYKNKKSPQNKEQTIVKEVIQHNLLDDSDLDNLLLQCSQKAEATYHKQVKRKKENDCSIIIGGEMDSIDEMLLTIPVDEKEIESLVSEKKQSTDNTSGYGTATGQCKNSLTRHNSMPTFSPQSKFMVSHNTVTNFVRHNSMPPKDEQEQEQEIKNKCIVWTSSSSESMSPEIEKPRCTQEEIKRKRLEAIQRREASKQKKTSLFIKSAINLRNKISNSKNDKR